MGVKATMSQTSELHQVGHTQAVDTILTKAIGSIFDDPRAGLLPMVFRVTHRLLRAKQRNSCSLDDYHHITTEFRKMAHIQTESGWTEKFRKTI
jgi:hypothetical protein